MCVCMYIAWNGMFKCQIGVWDSNRGLNITRAAMPGQVVRPPPANRTLIITSIEVRLKRSHYDNMTCISRTGIHSAIGLVI